MLAIVAAVLFAIALIMDLAHVGLGSAITPTTLLEAGLLCVALHLAGVGATTSRPTWSRRRVRR
jgi:hypothetical protein